MIPSRTTAAGVLISLKPEFAEAIAEGRKTVELRRRFPKVERGCRLVIYATQPVGAVVGFATIRDVIFASPTAIERTYRSRAALSRRRFRAYFAGCARAVAVEIENHISIGPHRLDDLPLILPGFLAPQSWRYVTASEIHALQQPAVGRGGSGSVCDEAAE